MNYRLIFRLIGSVLKYEGYFMILPMIVAFLYEEKLGPFVITIIIITLISIPLHFVKVKDKIFRTREGFVAVALSWIMLSIIGALPFFFSGYFNNYIDCLFESISGFTTTGASILTKVEIIPKGILFWRSFTHWIGGMGVLVFMLAIMPNMTASSVNLLKAESPGPSPSKFVPKLKETARIMYIVYFVMTIIQIILLKISGLPFFDSVIHTFGSAGTGGFSSMNLSVGAYNNVFAEVIITIFMFLFGVNFTLYYYVLKKDFKSFFKDEEFILYLGIVIVSIALITINITGMYNSPWTALRHSSFQVSTIMTTTGYSSTDFGLWPTFSKTILVLLMFIGASAGSTGGGIKVIRILVLKKFLKNEIRKLIHPRMINTVKVNSKKVENTVIMKICIFFFVYFFILILSTIVISIDGNDLVTNFTAVISALSNIGPGLELVGPMGNYSFFSGFSKLILSFCMLAGRLEFFPILVLFVPSLWKRVVN